MPKAIPLDFSIMWVNNFLFLVKPVWSECLSLVTENILTNSRYKGLVAIYHFHLTTTLTIRLWNIGFIFPHKPHTLNGLNRSYSKRARGRYSWGHMQILRYSINNINSKHLLNVTVFILEALFNSSFTTFQGKYSYYLYFKYGETNSERLRNLPSSRDKRWCHRVQNELSTL